MSENGESWIDELMVRCTPDLSHSEQRAGLLLLRELAGGDAGSGPVARAETGSGGEAESLLSGSSLAASIDRGPEGSIRGFLGLSLQPTCHRLRVAGRDLWTWCALDSLYLPELLGSPASITSTDPQNGTEIRIALNAGEIQSLHPDGTVLSIVRPQSWDCTSACSVKRTACSFIFFFESKDSAATWLGAQPNCSELGILPVRQAVEISRKVNAATFGSALAELAGRS